MPKSYADLLKEARSEIPELTPAEADALRTTDGVTLVDVREKDERDEDRRRRSPMACRPETYRRRCDVHAFSWAFFLGCVAGRNGVSSRPAFCNAVWSSYGADSIRLGGSRLRSCLVLAIRRSGQGEHDLH
jgi:hypothetical protein